MLRVLLSTRKEVVHLLLDTDCMLPGSSGNIKPEILAEMDCPPNFALDHVTYIGTKEFEDAFESQIWHDSIKSDFELDDDTWSVADIEGIKKVSPKFSDDLVKFIYGKVKPHERQRVRKHGVAAALAKHCVTDSLVPPQLIDALEKVRKRAKAI